MALKGTVTNFINYDPPQGTEYSWDNAGDGSLFDVADAYVTYTDSTKSTTGIAFNAGDDKPLIKYVPDLVEVWIDFDYYNAGQWRWVQVFLNGNKSIGLNGTDDSTFFRFYTNEYAGNAGINTIRLHFDTTTNQAEIWINGEKKQIVSNAKLKDSYIKSIAFSPSGWSSSFASHTSNAISNIHISGKRLKVDNTLPEGVAGRTRTFVTHYPHQGLHLAPLQVFFTYKQDDKINLWEGTDSAIKGYTSATVNYRPHGGVDVTPQAMLVSYRKHDGVDIHKVLPFYLQRLEDGSILYTIPNGIAGHVTPFIIQRLKLACSYLNGMNLDRVQGIAIQNAYFPLKGIKVMNGIPILNNNTTDQSKGDA